MGDRDKVLILTPVKDAEPFLDGYFESLSRITYPHELLSIAFLESDSRDRTYQALSARLHELGGGFRSAALWKEDFGFRFPPGVPRWAGPWQVERRTVLAKSRNHLLFRALDDEDWVLWLDVDVVEYPPNIVETLLSTGKEIVTPNCVLKWGGPSYDRNAWRDKGRVHLHDLREEGDLARLHAVGGTMLLIRADLHRDGLIFPPFLYGKESPLIRANNLLWGTDDIPKEIEAQTFGEIETEGLGIMARDMGHECWGMPNLEIRHRDS